uniref:Uncharacterized protein n=1 Tax=Avena sativa TaxID=4498 RepID=A0ACD5WRL9_AVESA
MPLFGHWADLPPELVCRIGDFLDLKCYASARGGCTAWRCALAPPSPSLLLVPDDDACSPSAASISTRRSFQLKSTPPGTHCVGASNGWLALCVYIYSGQSMLSLFNPTIASKIALPALIHGSSNRVSKIVLAPNPALDDFVAAAICSTDRLAYVTAGARRWAVLDPVRLAVGDHLTDLVYHENERKGLVYCLTSHGDVHVLRLPERRRREPLFADEPSPLPLLPITRPRREFTAVTAQRIEDDRRRRAHHLYAMIHKRTLGPDLNARANVEPLLSLPFNPATSFAPPYNKVSTFTSAKNLVFCEGNLYQIWRNTSCTVTLQLPGGGRRRVAENEVFVLRYYPQRQPCWDAVTDLGGYSVFVGRNNAVSVCAQGVPGLKGNCVYWIGGRGRDQCMVFDMATGKTTACLQAAAAAAGAVPQITICWYTSSPALEFAAFMERLNKQHSTDASILLVSELRSLFYSIHSSTKNETNYY